MRSTRSWALVVWCVAAAGVTAQQNQRPAPDRNADSITLQFANTPIRDAARTLSEQIGQLVLVDDEIETQVTIEREVRRDMALLAFAAAAQLAPRPAAIFCSADEARGESVLQREFKVKLSLEEETALPDIAKELAKQSGTRVLCTEAVVDLKVSYQSDEEANLADVLSAVAEKAGCRWVRGWVLVRVDPADLLRGLEDFNSQPEAERRGQFDSGFDEFMNRFRNEDPAGRRAIVDRIVGGIDMLAGMLNGADPETRARFKQGLAPLIQRGLQRFVGLNAREQAELMPVVQALKKLQ